MTTGDPPSLPPDWLARCSNRQRGEANMWQLEPTGTAPPPGEPAESRRSGELISCVMVSRGDARVARFAIECYRRQTYRNTELVIVTDDASGGLEEHVAGLGDPRLHFHRVGASGSDSLRLGNLRNIGIGLARGSYIAQWDDDDLCDPGRLAVSRRVLREAGAAAVFLERWVIVSPGRGRVALSGQRLWEGSMLARRDALPIYPNLPRGEDTAFVNLLRRQHRVAVLDCPELYCYFETGANAWPAAHFADLHAAAAAGWTGDEGARILASLAERMPVREYLDYLRSRGGGTG